MWNILAAGLLVLSAGPNDVTVKPLTGEVVSGTLVGLTPDAIVVKNDSGEKLLDLRNIVAVTRGGVESAVSLAPALRVILLDGSEFPIEAFTVKQGKASAKLLSGQDAEFRTRALRAVRLKTPLESLDGAWREMLDVKAAGDVIVLRKNSPAGPDGKSELVLDKLEGLVQDIDAETVKFEYDGDTIPVKREKLEGIVFHSPVERDLAAPICRLTDTNGGRWDVRKLSFADGQLKIETPAGAIVDLPLMILKKLDFSVGNTTYLSDLEPDSEEWTPFIDSPALRTRLAKLYQPRRDTAFDGGRLTLGGQSYDKGLAIHSRTKLVYRVPRDGQRLLATVGIDDRTGDDGNVKLIISGDDRVLLEKTITGKDEPLELSLDIAGARRITVLVDFGDEIDIGDHLNFCNARITK